MNHVYQLHCVPTALCTDCVMYLGNSMSLKVDDAGNTQLDTSKHRDNLQNVVIK